LAAERPKICAAIVNSDVKAINKMEPAVDLWEVRIDLIGKGWREVAEQLKKPWIACNRRAEEGGKWQGGERRRIKELLSALEIGADTIDIELGTPGVEDVAAEIKARAECLISYHNLAETPPLDRLKQTIINELAAGADICKVATTARSFKDNLALLQLMTDFQNVQVVAFAMGLAGQVSRVLCPLAGGCFTYASLAEGKESAEGQVTVGELRRIYGILEGGADDWSDVQVVL
jgi:3-dehydroquinate dehydratase-1